MGRLVTVVGLVVLGGWGWPSPGCSRSARTPPVVDPQVVTVSTVRRRPDPAARTHSFASRLAPPAPGC
jgi:hypothetical protein